MAKIEIVASFDTTARESLATEIGAAFPDFDVSHRRTDYLPNPTLLEAVAVAVAAGVSKDVIVGLAKLTKEWVQKRIEAGEADAIDVRIDDPDGEPVEWREGDIED